MHGRKTNLRVKEYGVDVVHVNELQVHLVVVALSHLSIRAPILFNY